MALSALSVHSTNPKTSALKPENKVDIYGVLRGECNNCTECPQFISIPGHVLCAYCGCPPGRHQRPETETEDLSIPELERMIERRRPDSESSHDEPEEDGEDGEDNDDDEDDSSDTESTSSGVSSLASGRGGGRRWRPSWQAAAPPTRVQRLLEEEPVPRDIQIEHSWNPDDSSSNIYVKEDDPLTFHRNPTFQTTDGIRGKQGYSRGLHIWELRWPRDSRGTHPVVGVATAHSPLSEKGYKRLVGSNNTSWGWCIKSKELFHDSRKFRNGVQYPHGISPNAKVPEYFYMVLDLDRGTLSYQVDNDFLGIAFSGLRGKVLYPVVSAVWGHCEVTLRYIGSHEFKSPPGDAASSQEPPLPSQEPPLPSQDPLSSENNDS